MEVPRERPGQGLEWFTLTGLLCVQGIERPCLSIKVAYKSIVSEIAVLPTQVALSSIPDNWRQMQPGRRRSLAQILEMQSVLYDKITNSKASLAEKAQAARAWDVLEDRKRELRGKPKAGMLRPQPRKRLKPHVPITPVEL